MTRNSLLLLIFILLGAVSCREYLEEDPKGRIDEQFLSSEKGLEDLSLSLYHRGRLIVEDLTYLGEFPTDIFTHSLNSNDIIQLTHSNNSEMPSLSSLSTAWSDLYAGINNINLGLDVLQKNAFSGSDVIKGELSFFRAWYYLMIVETWGEGAHYTIEPTSSVVTDGHQTTIDVFYNTIIADIDTAIATLPVQPAEWGRLSKPAAEAMKARILLALAGYGDDVISKCNVGSRNDLYAQAKALADGVIHQYNFKLLDHYADLFDVNNEENDEVIWSVQFTATDKFNTDGQQLHRYWVPNYNKSARTQEIVPRMYGHSIYYGREYRWIMMTRYFLLLFDQNDQRRDATIQTVWRALWDESEQQEDATGVPVKNGMPTDTVLFKPIYDVNDQMAAQYTARGIAIDGLNDIYEADGTPKQNARGLYHTMKKYLDPSRLVPKQEQSGKDVNILRLGEQYLIAAECAYYLGDKAGAAKYIDDLRIRARTSPSDLPVNAGDIDIDFILDERARELGGELMRWFDLKRTHTLVSRVVAHNPDGKDIQASNELRPIPQSELDKITNPDVFKQNPGYPAK